MKGGFVYTRWLLAMTFCCLMGLLAVGMMTVHSKRIIRIQAANLNRKEAQLEELERRQNVLDTDLASAFNPEYLKRLIAASGLRLGPAREDRIIIVPVSDNRSEDSLVSQSSKPLAVYPGRLALANSDRREGE